MASIDIIDYTGRGMPQGGTYAARLLAFTKATRLQMDPAGFDAFLDKPWSDIEPELAYMANTIPSSWEFVDVTFIISEVSRAAAQQITRTRFTPMETDMFGAYAMQSQRVTDMSRANWHIPDTVKNKADYDYRLCLSMEGYDIAIDRGESLEDARGLLPMNLHCNLVVKYNLRMLAELFRKRESLRVQGEFGTIVRLMKIATLAVWPWAAPFFVPKDHAAIEIIERIAAELGPEQRRELAKAADLLKV